jgi:DnaK suppressor protein
MADEAMDLASFRQLLLVKQQELQEIAASSRAAAQTVELDQTRMGRLSRMDALQAQAMSAESERRRVKSLNRIAAALRRLDTDDYGYCRDCGELINPERLGLDPSVALCIQCAENAERGE